MQGFGFSLRDLYPELTSVVSTREATQPEEAEQFHYRTIEQGDVVTPGKQWTIWGTLALLFIVLVTFGYIK